MINYPNYLRVIKLSWFNLAGFYVVIEIYMIANAILDVLKTNQWQPLITKIFLGTPFLMLTYGLIPLVVFYVLMLLLDVVLFATIKWSALFIVLLEWSIISPIFIYWSFKYDYWLWMALVASFLVTQVLRSQKLALGQAT